MQRVNISRKELRDSIKENYFLPLIASLKNTGLNEAKIIKNLVRRIQITMANSQMALFGQRKSLYDQLELEYLLAHTELHIKYIHLAFLYLDRNTQENEFPDQDSVAIQTCIRELFHDYLNPLPLIQPKNPDTISIPKNANMYQDSKLHKLPVELQEKIYSYLTCESIFSFKRTCKSDYFLHKSFQNKQENILYMLADDVKITRDRGMLEGSYDIVLRENIPENEIIHSLMNKNKKEIRIFQSLYQALEYAHSLHHGGHIFDNEKHGYIPSLWTVSFIGNIADLTFTEEKIIMNSGVSSSSYDGNRRDVMVSSAMISKNSVQPLVGSVIYSYSDFAEYKTFNTINFREYLEKENDKFSMSNCQVM